MVAGSLVPVFAHVPSTEIIRIDSLGGSVDSSRIEHIRLDLLLQNVAMPDQEPTEMLVYFGRANRGDGATIKDHRDHLDCGAPAERARFAATGNHQKYVGD